MAQHEISICRVSNGIISRSHFNLRSSCRNDPVTKPSSDRAGNQEEHWPGEQEAIGDPSVIEEARCLGIERAEEAFETTRRTVWIKDAGVSRLPGCEPNQKCKSYR